MSVRETTNGFKCLARKGTAGQEVFIGTTKMNIEGVKVRHAPMTDGLGSCRGQTNMRHDWMLSTKTDGYLSRVLLFGSRVTKSTPCSMRAADCSLSRRK